MTPNEFGCVALGAMHDLVEMPEDQYSKAKNTLFEQAQNENVTRIFTVLFQVTDSYREQRKGGLITPITNPPQMME